MAWLEAGIGALLRGLGEVTCRHQWVRARFDDGSYGYRCSACMKPYGLTWNALLQLSSRRSLAHTAGMPHSRPLTKPLPAAPRRWNVIALSTPSEADDLRPAA